MPNSDIIRILFIDDDEDDYILLNSILKQSEHGQHNVQWISSYEEAMQLVSVAFSDYDIFIVDYFLGSPGELGLNIIRALRDVDPYVPIILMTGMDNHETDIQAMKLGATDYIVKGIHMFTLLERSIRYNVEHARFVRSLSASQKQYQTLFDLSKDAVFMLDLEGYFLDCNQMAGDMFQYPVEDLKQLHFRDITPSQGITTSEQIFASILNDERYTMLERPALKKDGTVFPIQIDIQLVKDERDRPAYVQAVVRDLSDQTQLAERQIMLEQERHQRATFMQIFHAYSAQLRTPLQSSLDLLQQGTATDTTTPMIQEQLTHVMQQIEDLHTITRLEMMTEVQKNVTELHPLLMTTIKSLQTPVKPHCTMQFADQDLAIACHVSLLSDAIGRLLKGVCVGLSIEDTVVVETRAIQNMHQIQIRTDGDVSRLQSVPAIPNHLYPAPTDPVYALDMTRGELSLSISRRIIGLHHGMLTLDSSDNTGTTITIMLPAHL